MDTLYRLVLAFRQVPCHAAKRSIESCALPQTHPYKQKMLSNKFGLSPASWHSRLAWIGTQRPRGLMAESFLNKRYIALTFSPLCVLGATLAFSASFLSKVSGPRRADKQPVRRCGTIRLSPERPKPISRGCQAVVLRYVLVLAETCFDRSVHGGLACPTRRDTPQIT